MNDSFAYLSVMISIVLGLAAAHVLGSLVRVINNRERIVMYWPSLLWSATLFLLIAQLWWADASLRTYTAWNFGAFLVLLAQPAALYSFARSSYRCPTAQAPSICTPRSHETALGSSACSWC